MNTSITTQSGGIRVAARPRSESREAFLLRHFGSGYSWVEGAAYEFLKDLSNMTADVRETSTWHWYELSNGGAYMAPGLVSGVVHLKTNWYEGNLSTEAAAIIACLHTFNVLAFHGQGEAFEWHFRWLRRFAVRHVEAIEILDACEC